MHAGRGAEGVGAGHRIVHRELVSGDARGELYEAHQLGHVARRVDRMAEQLEVDQQLIDGGIPDPLADPRRAPVQPRGPRGARGERVGERQAAVVVAVPVEAHLDVGFLHYP